LNEQAIRWLDDESARPFFLFLHYMDVHSPWRPPKEYDVFGPEGVDKYDASILFVDSQIGALCEELEKRGLADDTWIIITADHGEEFLEHGNERWGHGVTLYQEVLRVPLIFHHPSEAASGKRVRRQVRLIDVAPTILDLLRIPILQDMEGVSLADDVAETAAVERQDLVAFSQVGLNDAAPDKDLIAVTTPEYGYILDLVSGDEELYDLKSDPGETRNAATFQSCRRQKIQGRRSAISQNRDRQT
jgi:arylsulfatase A-like enzyme